MTSGWRGHIKEVAFILLIAVLGVAIAGYIFSRQNVSPPAWLPVLGKQYFHVDARFERAPGVMPGQGQAVTIAGVTVGKVDGVRLDQGQAVVRLKIDEDHARIYPDATMLLRPKTPLKDMIVELDPGTKASGRPLRDGATLGVDATEPDVNFDEVIRNLDADTRAQLAALLGEAGTALGGSGGRALARDLRRFEPLSRNAAKASALLATRGQLTRRLVTNLGRITKELGSSDAQLGRFVTANDAMFSRFAAQNDDLGATIRRLPDALATTTTALQKAGRLSATLSQGLPKIRPATKGLAPALKELEPMLRKTRPVLEGQLRPFARDAQPTAKALQPAVAKLEKATPDLNRLTTVLNGLFDAMAYDPPGNGPNDQSFLFYLPWAAHNTNSVLSTQDAVGPLRRAVLQYTCGSLNILENFRNYNDPKTTTNNPTMTALVGLLNTPDFQTTCPQGIGTK
ncbi:MlaD family protein [Patulibacter sp. S7RM1-6]